MEKSLSERIAARAAGKMTLLSHRAQNRAVFLALRPDIKQALKEGWSVRSIWETLHEEGKITFCYSSFCDYTNRLILQVVPEPSANEPGCAGKIIKTAEAAPKTKESSEIRGFTFNPSPKIEDLI